MLTCVQANFAEGLGEQEADEPTADSAGRHVAVLVAAASEACGAERLLPGGPPDCSQQDAIQGA